MEENSCNMSLLFRTWRAGWVSPDKREVHCESATGRHRVWAMFSLFYGLWKYVFTKDEFRVLILGVDKAGKTVVALSLYFPF
jgi:hypothetical protein